MKLCARCGFLINVHFMLRLSVTSESRKNRRVSKCETLRLYLHFVMYLYSAFPTSSACNESCVWEEERRCLAGGESKAAAGIKGENALGYNLIRGVGSVRRRRPICAEAGRELPSLSGR